MTLPTLLVTVLLCAALILSKRRAVLPIFIVGMCFVPSDQAIVIAGLDFKTLRIFAFAGMLRLVLRNELSVRANKQDFIFSMWNLYGFFAYVALWASSSALFYQLGVLVDYAFIYVVFRNYLRSMRDVQLCFEWLVYCTIALTPFVIYEHTQNVNPFYIFGRDATSFREGRVRCSAAFSHAILLGSFSASILPLALALKSSARSISRKIAMSLGIVCSIYLTIASASSGPIIALAAGLFLYLLFKQRKYLGLTTLSMVGLAVVLHLVMDKPVWHLISRIDIAGGSTGYHRYFLIDRTIANFSEWALIGVKGVAHWGVHAGDVTSMYIYQAVTGGLATFALFVWLMIRTVHTIWLCSLNFPTHGSRIFAWAAVCFAMTHAVSFMSVAYFGQISMLIMFLFAFGAALKDKRFIAASFSGNDINRDK